MLLLCALALTEVPPVELALRAELLRATADLALPEARRPSLIAYDLLDGEVASVFAEGGAVVEANVARHRSLRVEVRVGDNRLDSSNFEAFFERSGVTSKALPDEDGLVALRREVWLATDSAYKGAVEQYARKVAALGDDTAPRADDWSPAPVADVPIEVGAPELRPTRIEPVREAARRLTGLALETPGVERAQAAGRDWQGRRLVLTSEGTRVWRPTGATVLRVELVARAADGSEVVDERSWIVRAPEDLPPLQVMEAEVREMAAWVAETAARPAPEDYLGPVIFEAPAATELFSQLLAGELVGTPPPRFDGDAMFSRGRSPVGRLGRRVLPLGWTVVDDPSLPSDALGAYASDHEGVVPRRVELVKDGVVQELLMSRTPSRDRGASTGHGRSLGNDRRAAMPGVVTVEPSRTTSTRRLRRVALRLAGQTGKDFVLVVRRLQPPGMVAALDVAVTGEGPLSGLTMPLEACRLYADGSCVPERSLRFLGVDRRVLRDVVLAAEGGGPTDLLDGPPGPARFQIGATGGVPVTWDVPAVLIGELELEATPGGEPRLLRPPPRDR